MVDDRDASQGVDAMEAALLESLGDFWWTSRNRRQWNQAWSAYQRALDFWAGSSELEVAGSLSEHSMEASAVPQARPYEIYGSAGNYLPVDVLVAPPALPRLRRIVPTLTFWLGFFNSAGGAGTLLRAHPASLREGN